MLSIEESTKRQDELEQLLIEMSQTPEPLEEGDPQISAFASRLRDLYVKDFRHRYSSFFGILVDIDGEELDGNLEYLSNNIIKVREYVDRNCTTEDKAYMSLYKPLMKLSDHLNLEIARYNHFVGQNKEIEALKQQNHELQKQLRDTTDELVAATTKLDEANTRFTGAETKLNNAETKLMRSHRKVKKSLSSIHIDIIAVLSIFASIVLTFSGSMTVLGSALTGMQEVHAFKATFFVLLCGFVLGNVIFLMMHLVGKLTGRSIYAPCKTENCSCEKNKTPACRGLTRIRKRLPYIFWLNVILIGLMGLDIVAWILENHLNFIQ